LKGVAPFANFARIRAILWEMHCPMAENWIEAIGAISGGATEQAACHPSGSSYWQSSGVNPERLQYQADLPAGLHFGCGVTPGIESVAPFGQMAVTGAGATLVICSAPVTMTTILAPGQFHSAGLSAELSQLDGFGPLADFARRQGNVCMALSGVPGTVIARLAMPIDPWFQGTAREIAREARALELVAVFEEALCRPRPLEADAPRSRGLAREACAIIEAEFERPLSIADLAQRTGCSPRTLSEAFRREFGISIGGYLTRFRLDQAGRLLRQGVRPTEVAYRVGYSPAHFATAFKRQHGVVPSRWRS
jgi:AraC family transcriptional activator of pyochelin receptor